MLQVLKFDSYGPMVYQDKYHLLNTLNEQFTYYRFMFPWTKLS